MSISTGPNVALGTSVTKGTGVVFGVSVQGGTNAAPPPVINARILQIAGGGFGGRQLSSGGGAGEYLELTGQTIPPGSYPIVIGQGGVDATSTLATATTGFGRTLNPGGSAAGTQANRAGGSGAGAAFGTALPGLSVKTAGGLGNDGGGLNGDNSGDGGGGAGAAGNNGSGAGAFGGNGGSGVTSDITGTPVGRAGGGGGGGNTTGGAATDGGGNGGGGTLVPGVNAAPNTGGGGGGASGGGNSVGGHGGSGVTIIRYPIAGNPICTGGDSVFTVGGDRVHVFNNSGTFVVPA